MWQTWGRVPGLGFWQANDCTKLQPLACNFLLLWLKPTVCLCKYRARLLHSIFHRYVPRFYFVSLMTLTFTNLGFKNTSTVAWTKSFLQNIKRHPAARRVSEASGSLSEGKQIYVWGGGREHKPLISGFSGKEYKAPRSLALRRQQLPFNTANSLPSCSGNSTMAFNYTVKAGERGNRLRPIEKRGRMQGGQRGGRR